MEALTLTRDVVLEAVECWKCGGMYGLTKQFNNQAQKDGRIWHCPYCLAAACYGEGENARLRRELEDAEAGRAREVARHDQTRASLRATKGAKTRLQRRIARGTCPCCEKYFKDLHSHMQAEHPNFKKED